MRFERCDFAEGPAERFHVVVANPPYVRSDAINGLQPGVRDFDPRTALDGGADGLAAYRVILEAHRFAFARGRSARLRGRLRSGRCGRRALPRGGAEGGASARRSCRAGARGYRRANGAESRMRGDKKSAWKSRAVRLASIRKPERSRWARFPFPADKHRDRRKLVRSRRHRNGRLDLRIVEVGG